jgi:sucrose-6F-phosphate phosphohydrolase
MLPRLLLCTDLDRTLLPNGSQPQSADALTVLSALAARPEVVLAYVSGRHRQLVADAIAEYRVPQPDWVIGDVGTTIYQVQDSAWRHWLDWEQHIATAWKGKTAPDLRPLFDDLAALQLQEEDKQNRFKLSYYLPMASDVAALEAEMRRRLQQHDLAANLIYSVDEAAQVGLLDVLPTNANKLHAVEFMMEHLGFTLDNTLFAGDSGNDLPVVTSPIRSVLVANADPQVVQQAAIQSQARHSEDAFYLAQGGFLNMNGNYSAGIVEGVAHYFPEYRSWLQSL